MGLLDKLWDDTVAGPQPEQGLSRLRKWATFNSAGGTVLPTAGIIERPAMITRSITIVKPELNGLAAAGETVSDPASPVGSSTPGSPMSWTPRGEYLKKFRRNSTGIDGNERAHEPRSPTVYDWVVIGALDR